MIDRSTWQKGLLVILLLAAAGAFYLYSRASDPASLPGASLVYLDPLRLAPQSGEEEAAEPVADSAAQPAVEVDEVTAGAADPSALDAVDPGDDPGEAIAVMSQAFSRAEEFDRVRIARLQGRSRRLEALESMLASPELSEAARASIQQELLSLIRLEEVERQAEGLLVARGLADALVVIGDQGVEVVVPDLIDANEAGRIGELVSRLSGIAVDRIVIVDGAPLHR